MPINRAFDYLRQDYHDFIDHLKSQKSSNHSLDLEEPLDPAENHSSSSTKLNRKHGHYLNLLLAEFSQGEHDLIHLDLMITYLNKLKESMIDEYLASSTSSTSSSTSTNHIKSLLDQDLLNPGPSGSSLSLPNPQMMLSNYGNLPPPPPPPPSLMSLLNHNNQQMRPSSLMSVQTSSSGFSNSNGSNIKPYTNNTNNTCNNNNISKRF
jgi:hypothetical protein